MNLANLETFDAGLFYTRTLTLAGHWASELVSNLV